ncbi:MAG: CBS domain-containing protein [Deltaproteobacteria bacterium]|nr:CBS domain-containing protein [Deltaproteobacteria bacterium]
MLIRDWMTRDVITVATDTSMMKASKLLKEHDIRRLPVVDDKGTLLGIVTDRDIKDASPSKATTLDVHELYYLLSEIKIKDIMTANPYTIHVDDTVEKAAAVMLDKRISGLPVLDDHDKVVGIITDTDVFKVLINITGVYLGGVQLGLRLPNSQGSLKAVLDDLRAGKARIISIMTAYGQTDAEHRDVYIRIHDMEKSLENKLEEELRAKYDLTYWVRDNINPTVL